jgi:hypothetical protein
MTPQEMTAIRDKRVRAALNVETPDRIPIFMSGQGFFKFIDPTATLADYFNRPEYIDNLQIEAAKLPDLAEMDSGPVCGWVSAPEMERFASMFFANMRLPGRELPPDALWNIDEQGPMTEADYDMVIEKGWEHTTQELYKRIGFDPAKAPPPDMAYLGPLFGRIAQLGKTSINGKGLFPFPPFEVLSGARKLNNFVRDLRRIPDKVRAALDVIEDASVKETIRQCQQRPLEFAFIGGTRSGSTFISPATFEKFYFTYYRKLVPAMKAINVRTWLHMDNDWSGFLHYFREFPKGQCIWDPDQMTGILKIKEALGDRMCITGDVPPSLLSVGTPDECYAYARKLCAEMGKTGFIMSAGCMAPIDAKRENIAAVIAATVDA